ncbi:MAG TPA: peroxiredoxin [Candidatus Thermoplasmatota archaeon]|jgi:peroxiredoxin Q/BCP|nr:peroxiredoxin [Candidatus Thermoplasmatota archaeon]
MADANGIVEGVPAPNVQLWDHNGQEWKLSDLRGKALVLYFYPADMTSGCTTEACEFNGSLAQFEALRTRVVGVSPDDAASHQKFRAKHGLDFPLAYDPSLKAFEAFGVWQEKNLYGRKSMGVVRSTFLIDADGVVRGVWRRVKAEGHALAVLEAVRSLEKQRQG